MNTKCNAESLNLMVPVYVIQHRILYEASTWSSDALLFKVWSVGQRERASPGSISNATS